MLDSIAALSIATGVNPDFVTQYTAQTTLLSRRVDDLIAYFDKRDTNIELAIYASEQNITRLTGLLDTPRTFDRPGDSPAAFSHSLLGSALSMAPLTSSDVLKDALGDAGKIMGAGFLAPRSSVYYDPDTFYVVRAIYWRNQDVPDPNNNAIDFGIQWLNENDEDVGTTLLVRENNLRVQDGAIARSYRVPSNVNDLPRISAPLNAVAWRPYIETYGNDGVTAVHLLSVHDVTYAGVFSPDVEALQNRVRQLESLLTAGLPLGAVTLPGYTVAELQSMVPTFGRKAMAIDGRAPDAAGALEPAGAGTGVEVTGTGKLWAISGTRQAVQA
jgi:hypothetical protein